MKGKKRNWMAVATVCIAVALTGCTAPAGNEPPVAMGRYVEEALPLPGEVVSLWDISVREDGAFQVFGEDGSGALHLWTLGKGEKEWQVSSPAWTDTLKSYSLYSVSVDAQGIPWFTWTPDDPQLEELYTAGDDGAIEAYIPLPYPLATVAEGAVQTLLPLMQNSEGVNAQSFLVEGSHIAAYLEDMVVYDVESGKPLLTVETSDYIQPGDYLLKGDLFALASMSSIQLYSVSEGRRTGEIAVEGPAFAAQKTDFYDFSAAGRTVIAGTGEPGVIAYANSGGIYRASLDGLLQEKVVTGELTSLIQPSCRIERLFVVEDDYYLYITDRDSLPWQLSGAALLRFRYDGDVPAVPTTELRVYALEDMPTVRQSAAFFQRANPDVQVRLDIAGVSEGALTAEDALRALSTELLAGKGPDVLILDGLPAESYREKGVLLDLSGALPRELQDQLLPGPLSCWAEGGAIYGAPARFTLPMLLADDSASARTDSLEGLLEYLMELDSPQTGTPPGELFPLLLRSYWAEWFDEDGSLDEAAISRAIERAGHLLERFRDKDTEKLWDARGDARVGAIGWIDGWTPFFISELTAVEHLRGPYTAVREYGAVYIPYPSGAQARLYPRSVVAVNAGSLQQELAVAFVETMLSGPVQVLQLGDGLPVNRPALEENMRNPSGEAAARFGVSFWDEFSGGVEKGRTLPLYWPDDTFFAAFLETVSAVDHCVPVNGVVEEMVTDEALLYFRGEQPLEATVRAIKRKLDIFQGE